MWVQFLTPKTNPLDPRVAVVKMFEMGGSCFFSCKNIDPKLHYFCGDYFRRVIFSTSKNQEFGKMFIFITFVQNFHQLQKINASTLKDQVCIRPFKLPKWFLLFAASSLHFLPHLSDSPKMADGLAGHPRLSKVLQRPIEAEPKRAGKREMRKGPR